MFTIGGEPSRWLNHAIQQVLDWHSWIHENLSYARQLMPYVDYPRGFVFIGRRNELSHQKRNRLKRLCYEYRKTVEIHTLDWFISAAESVAKMIGSNGGGWILPSRALSHSDLAQGLPEYAHEWLMSPFAESAKEIFLKTSLEQREDNYLQNRDLFLSDED
jgi:hypothetical protein